MTQSETTAIILAAGLSRRMGSKNKLLLPVNGVPMIRHVVERYCQAVDGDVLVVTGHDAAAVTCALTGTRAKIVLNQHYAQGQFTSVASGLRHAEPAKTLLIGLGDQALIETRDIADLLAAHRAADPSKISIPVWEEARGNPIVVPQSLRARLLDDPDRPGCKKFTRTRPDLVQHLPLAARGFYVDVDTPEAYAALVTSLKPLSPFARLRRKFALTPEQADQLATIKFPCC